MSLESGAPDSPRAGARGKTSASEHSSRAACQAAEAFSAPFRGRRRKPSGFEGGKRSLPTEGAKRPGEGG